MGDWVQVSITIAFIIIAIYVIVKLILRSSPAGEDSEESESPADNIVK